MNCTSFINELLFFFQHNMLSHLYYLFLIPESMLNVHKKLSITNLFPNSLCVHLTVCPFVKHVLWLPISLGEQQPFWLEMTIFSGEDQTAKEIGTCKIENKEQKFNGS